MDSVLNHCPLACLYHKAKSAASCFSLSSNFMCFHESLEGFCLTFLVQVIHEQSFKIKSYKKLFIKKNHDSLTYPTLSPSLAQGGNDLWLFISRAAVFSLGATSIYLNNRFKLLFIDPLISDIFYWFWIRMNVCLAPSLYQSALPHIVLPLNNLRCKIDGCCLVTT